MTDMPLSAGWMLAAGLMTIGLVGVLTRRNLLFVLLSIEVMFNAAAVAFVVAGARWGQPDGQILFIFVVVIAAAEAAVGLALMLLYYRHFGTLDTRAADRLKG